MATTMASNTWFSHYPNITLIFTGFLSMHSLLPFLATQRLWKLKIKLFLMFWGFLRTLANMGPWKNITRCRTYFSIPVQISSKLDDTKLWGLSDWKWAIIPSIITFQYGLEIRVRRFLNSTLIKGGQHSRLCTFYFVEVEVPW